MSKFIDILSISFNKNKISFCINLILVSILLLIGLVGSINSSGVNLIISLFISLSGLTGLFSFLFSNGKKNNFDVKTKHNIYCKWSKVNKPNKQELETWIDWTIDFWIKTIKGHKKSEVLSDLKNILIKFFDKYDPPDSTGFIYTGLSNYRYKEISIWRPINRPVSHVESLVKHELSHFILHNMGFNSEDHHKMMKEFKLGH